MYYGNVVYFEKPSTKSKSIVYKSQFNKLSNLLIYLLLFSHTLNETKKTITFSFSKYIRVYYKTIFFMTVY